MDAILESARFENIRANMPEADRIAAIKRIHARGSTPVPVVYAELTKEYAAAGKISDIDIAGYIVFSVQPTRLFSTLTEANAAAAAIYADGEHCQVLAVPSSGLTASVNWAKVTTDSIDDGSDNFRASCAVLSSAFVPFGAFVDPFYWDEILEDICREDDVLSSMRVYEDDFEKLYDAPSGSWICSRSDGLVLRFRESTEWDIWMHHQYIVELIQHPDPKSELTKFYLEA